MAIQIAHETGCHVTKCSASNADYAPSVLTGHRIRPGNSEELVSGQDVVFDLIGGDTTKDCRVLRRRYPRLADREALRMSATNTAWLRQAVIHDRRETLRGLADASQQVY